MIQPILLSRFSYKGNFVAHICQSWRNSLYQIWGGDRSITGTANVSFRLQMCVVLLRFEVRAPKSRLQSKIEPNSTLFTPSVNIRGGWVKCVSRASSLAYQTSNIFLVRRRCTGLEIRHILAAHVSGGEAGGSFVAASFQSWGERPVSNLGR